MHFFKGILTQKHRIFSWKKRGLPEHPQAGRRQMFRQRKKKGLKEKK